MNTPAWADDDKIELVYICHPITSGCNTVSANARRINNIRKYVKLCGKVPISPLHTFQELFPVTGDQTEAYMYCVRLMKRCDLILTFPACGSMGCFWETLCAMELGLNVIAYNEQMYSEICTEIIQTCLLD